MLKNIDSALHNPAYAKQFIDNGEIHLSETVAPEGVINRDLNSIAWEIARQKDAVAKLALKPTAFLQIFITTSNG